MAKHAGWWSLSLDGNEHHELSQIDLEHIAELIVNGYNTGEIVKDEED
jgi:hypothetical protein